MQNSDGLDVFARGFWKMMERMKGRDLPWYLWILTCPLISCFAPVRKFVKGKWELWYDFIPQDKWFVRIVNRGPYSSGWYTVGEWTKEKNIDTYEWVAAREEYKIKKSYTYQQLIDKMEK